MEYGTRNIDENWEIEISPQKRVATKPEPFYGSQKA